MAVCYRAERTAAERTAEEIRAAGGAALPIQCDVRNSESIANAVRETTEQFGSVQMLVHCAGISTPRDHTELTEMHWMESIDVNLTGTYRVLFSVKDSMIENQFGRIVTVASIAALRPRPALMAYSAAKAGVISFTRSCATAFAPYNIRINCVAPGLIDTDMPDSLPEETRNAMIEATPMGRAGQPSEVAKLIRFCLSENASYTTGQTFICSGGRVSF